MSFCFSVVGPRARSPPVIDAAHPPLVDNLVELVPSQDDATFRTHNGSALPGPCPNPVPSYPIRNLSSSPSQLAPRSTLRIPTHVRVPGYKLVGLHI
ncbi:hypothetical protein BDV93DRAFT_525295 [Ceratobasidium sp. AG-I]|nr:hypothetical protein BDV93DRAFT_525295 [Ceratobasidium sp. AG-I]